MLSDAVDEPGNIFIPWFQTVVQKSDLPRRDVVEQMLRRVLQEDGTCFETFRRLKVRASKR